MSITRSMAYKVLGSKINEINIKSREFTGKYILNYLKNNIGGNLMI